MTENDPHYTEGGQEAQTLSDGPWNACQDSALDVHSAQS